MVANLLGRYLWEINELSKDRRGMTLEDLNKEWKRSSLYDGKPIIRKTWYEHRQQIGVQFGIYIECDKPTNRYYIKYPDEVGQTNLQSWLLNSFAVGNMLLQAKDMKDRIEYEPIPSGYAFLTDVIEAMRDSKVIAITYQGFWSGKEATFEVKPYALKAFRQRWYLIAGNTGFDQIRVYALDRIKDMEITVRKFKLPKDFSVRQLFEPYIGVSLEDKNTESIRIKVFNNQAKYLRSLPLHPSQREIETKEDYSVFEYHLKPTYEFEQELLSHGGDVVVMEPASLKDKMISRIKEMLWRYESFL